MESVFVFAILLSQVFCHGVEDAEEARSRSLERLSRIETVLHEGYELVTRTAATSVFPFRSYRNVAVLYYTMPEDVSEARFKFQAENVHLNNIGSCDPGDVLVHLKRGSIPVVNPDEYPFPDHYYTDPLLRNVITFKITSDGSDKSPTLLNPEPGEWFGIAYLPWQDPRTQQVSQEGLTANCQTVLYTDLQVKKELIHQINCYSPFNVILGETRAIFKCMASDTVDIMHLRINASRYYTNTAVIIQADYLPSITDNEIHCYFDYDEVEIRFQAIPSAWHYIIFERADNLNGTAHCESYNFASDTIENHTLVELMRENKPSFFSYDFLIASTDLAETISTINLTSHEVTTLRFKLARVKDIGGTLTVSASLLMDAWYYGGYIREKKSKNETLLKFSESDQFYKVVICLYEGFYSVPLATGFCRHNDATYPSLFVLNSTDSNSIYDTIAIPYPEAGAWYLSARLFCDDSVCPCRYGEDNGTYYVEADPDKLEEYRAESKSGFGREGGGGCNASAMISISSQPCSLGRCSGHGDCVFAVSGGVVLSTCVCSSGYGGWDCSDASRMDSAADMYSSILLLTLSNLLFLASMSVAISRQYYTEAAMYTFTMIMSTFYHACDAPPTVAYCITSHNLLQFGDFYCGIMSFWVTLLAMSVVDTALKSVLQLSGAIVVALLTTWNMQSLFAFVIPVIIGCVVTFSSWISAYVKAKAAYYPRVYYVKYFPIGLILVSVGLVCYAFLQTEQNYKYIHSVWHMIIALSVIFLLPVTKNASERSFKFTNGFRVLGRFQRRKNGPNYSRSDVTGSPSGSSDFLKDSEKDVTLSTSPGGKSDDSNNDCRNTP